MDDSVNGMSVTLAVLAGGAGVRMGFPKQNLEISQRPILEYLLNRFAWSGPTLLVTAPGLEKPRGHELFDAEAVDAVANEGPLRGMLTALENVKTRWVVVTTVDMPGVGREQLMWLGARLMERPEFTGLMLERVVAGEFQVEPFPCVCRTDAAELIAKRLAAGRRSVHSLAGEPSFAVELAPASWPPSCWTNLNSPDDYRAFRATI